MDTSQNLPAYDDIYSALALSPSAFDTLARNIEETMEKTLTLQRAFQEVLSSIVGLEKQIASTHTISQAFDKCRKLYDGLLWAGRDLATTAAGQFCLDGFTNVIVKKLILNPRVPHDDLVLEINIFRKGLPIGHVISHDGQGFSKLVLDLQGMESLVNQKTKTAQNMDPMITEASIHVRKLELDLQSAKNSIKNMLPLYLKYIKIDENSPAAVIFMVMAAQGVISLLVPGVDVSFEDIQKLRKAQENVDGLEKQLVHAREELVNLTAAAKKAQSEDAQWLLLSVQLGGLLARVSDVEPSLSALTRIADAVDSECQEYLTFLNNKEDVQDSAKKAKAVNRILSAAQIYKPLIETLTKFAIKVVPS